MIAEFSGNINGVFTLIGTSIAEFSGNINGVFILIGTSIAKFLVIVNNLDRGDSMN